MHNLKNTRAARSLAALILLAGVAACGQQQASQAPPPVEVGVVEVRPRPLALTLEHPATLRGVREVEVRARVSGILLRRLYKEGTRVKENEVLFKIDPAPFQAQVERARAELGVQQANLQQTQRERNRIVPLYEQGLVSLRDRDAAIAAHESAVAAVAAAQAALRSAELDLSYTDVRAPIAGLTSREVRSEGSLVTAGSDSSLLTHIVQSDQLYVEFAMPSAEAESLRAAMAGDGADKVAVRVMSTQGDTLVEGARIEFISPAVGDQTGTVAVRAIFANKNDALLPGQVVRARVEGVNIAGSLVIPKRAVLHSAQGSIVWVVGPDEKVAPRPVQLGITSGNDVAVVNGLAAGDRVVVEGILKVQPGAVVKAVQLQPDGTMPAPAGQPSAPAGQPASHAGQADDEDGKAAAS